MEKTDSARPNWSRNIPPKQTAFIYLLAKSLDYYSLEKEEKREAVEEIVQEVNSRFYNGQNARIYSEVRSLLNHIQEKHLRLEDIIDV